MCLTVLTNAQKKNVTDMRQYMTLATEVIATGSNRPAQGQSRDVTRAQDAQAGAAAIPARMTTFTALTGRKKQGFIHAMTAAVTK